MEPIFTIETIHDLTVHKEFSKSYLQASLLRSILLIFASLISISMIFQFHNRYYVYYYLFLAALLLILTLFQNRKGGDIQYKRMLQMNSGEPVHNIYTFTQEGIQGLNLKNDNKLNLGYDMFRSIIQSPNLLILVMEHRSCLILEKRWIKGGTVEELTAFLFNNCPKLKKKKVKTTTFGKWVQRIFILTMIITTIFAIVSLFGTSVLNKVTGKLHNDMSYQEMADKLSPLGINISDQTIAELEAYDEEYAFENGVNYYASASSTAKISDLLYWEGSGTYNEESDEWIPSTSGIFWFDAEVWNVEAIYGDFFSGLSAMNPELNFTNIQEDYSKADLDKGTGTVTVSFDYNGSHHTLEAAYNCDWMDASVLFAIGDILSQDDSPKDLYYANDGQGFLLYYGDKQQAAQLEQITDISFSNGSAVFPWF